MVLKSRSVGAVLAACAIGAVAGVAFAAPVFAGGSYSPALTVDGPTTGVTVLGDLDVSLDASSVIGYVRSDAGADHAFISVIVAGAPQTPVRVDQGHPPIIGKPEVGVSNGGRVTVLFANSDGLWARVRTAAGAPFSAAQKLGGPGSARPSAEMAPLTGVGYAAWSQGGQLRAAYLPRLVTQFSVYAGSANGDPASSAGDTAALSAKVSTSADGTGIVAFGESNGATTRVIARRLVRTRLSSVVLGAGAQSLDGHGGGAADRPEIAIEGDSSFAWIVYAQQFADGVRRGVVQRVRGSTLEAPQALAGGAAIGADTGPKLAANFYGGGLATVQSSDGTIWDSLLRNELVGAAVPLGSSPSGEVMTGSAFAASQYGLTAWLQGPAAELYARRLEDDDALPTPAPFGAAALLSVAQFGGVEASGGIDVAADAAGDSLIAFTQGSVGSRRLVVASFSLPPSPVSLDDVGVWRSSSLPALQWRPSTKGWAPAGYRVFVDGLLAGTTTAPTFTPLSALADGTHSWRVENFTRDGRSSTTPLAPLKIDTTIPKLSAKIRARGAVVSVVAKGSDAKPPAGSGLASISVNFGDSSRTVRIVGSSIAVKHRSARSGRLTVTVTATDRAGNKAVVTRKISVR